MPADTPVATLLRYLLIAALFAAARLALAQMDPKVMTPVPAVPDARLEIGTAQGTGVIPLHLTRAWTAAQPGVRRAIIVIHDWPHRDLRPGAFVASQAGNAADAIIMTPQRFLRGDAAAGRRRQADPVLAVIRTRMGSLL